MLQQRIFVQFLAMYLAMTNVLPHIEIAHMQQI